MKKILIFILVSVYANAEVYTTERMFTQEKISKYLTEIWNAPKVMKEREEKERRTKEKENFDIQKEKERRTEAKKKLLEQMNN